MLACTSKRGQGATVLSPLFDSPERVRVSGTFSSRRASMPLHRLQAAPATHVNKSVSTHLPCLYCVDTASCLPIPKHPVDARVVNFGNTLCILLDRQLLPLTTYVKQSQNVVENSMQRQFWCRSSEAGQKMGQDKLLELRQGQTRRNPLPVLAFCHFQTPKHLDCQHLRSNQENPGVQRAPDEFIDLK